MDSEEKKRCIRKISVIMMFCLTVKLVSPFEQKHTANQRNSEYIPSCSHTVNQHWIPIKTLADEEDYCREFCDQNAVHASGFAFSLCKSLFAPPVGADSESGIGMETTSRLLFQKFIGDNRRDVEERIPDSKQLSFTMNMGKKRTGEEA